MGALKIVLRLRKGLETSLNTYPSINDLYHSLYSGTLRFACTACSSTRAHIMLLSKISFGFACHNPYMYDEFYLNENKGPSSLVS